MEIICKIKKRIYKTENSIDIKNNKTNKQKMHMNRIIEKFADEQLHKYVDENKILSQEF